MPKNMDTAAFALPCLAVQAATELKFFSVADVLYFSFDARRRTWRLHTADGQNLPLRKALRAADIAAVCPLFVPIAQGCLVNVLYVAAIEHGTQCRLRPPFGDVRLAVSRRMMPGLRDRFPML